MSINHARANTKATPEAVFAACAKLAEANPAFRNEDVLAITGGGMSVVSRLVRIYRDNQALIESCGELDASTAINLVQATNALLATHKAKSIAALDKASETYIQVIAEMSEENARLVAELEVAQKRAEQEMETASNLRLDYDKTLQVLAARTQELELAKVNEQKLMSAQVAMQEKHEAKIEALNSRHADKLAEALEAQRKTFETEKEIVLNNLSTSKNILLKAEHAKVAALEKELTNAKISINQLTKQHEVVQSEYAAQRTRFNEFQTELHRALEEKREQLKEAQNIHHQLIAAFKSQQETQAGYIADNLSTVNKSANTLRPLLDELTEKLDQLLLKGESKTQV